jgi:type I restriction enzyme S subunit
VSNLVALGECTDRCLTWNPAADDPDGEFDYIDLSSVDKDTKRIEGISPIACSAAPSRARQIVKAGDILVSTVRPNLNGVAAVPIELDGATASTGYTVLRPRSDRVDGSYLFHWVKHPKFVGEMVRLATGASYPAVSDKIVRAAMIPLPSLPEQRRIAAILDKAEALRAKRREAIAKLDQLIDSGFREFCGSPYGPPVSIDQPSQPDAGQYVPLLSVARLATGHTPSRGIAEYWDGDIPWISLSDIRRLDGKIALNTEQQATAKGISNSSAVILPKDTVCFSRTASVGFATILGRQMATSQDFVNWVCGERINPLYLLAAFRASKQYLVAKSTGSTHKTIYFPVAKRFHVYLPPLSEQAKFGELMRLVWQQKDVAEQQVSAADRLFSSLQQAGFSSQL